MEVNNFSRTRVSMSSLVVQVSFNNPIKYGKAKELFIAPEGLYSGQVPPFPPRCILLQIPSLQPFYQARLMQE